MRFNVIADPPGGGGSEQDTCSQTIVIADDDPDPDPDPDPPDFDPTLVQVENCGLGFNRRSELERTPDQQLLLEFDLTDGNNAGSLNVTYRLTVGSQSFDFDRRTSAGQERESFPVDEIIPGPYPATADVSIEVLDAEPA